MSGLLSPRMQRGQDNPYDFWSEELRPYLEAVAAGKVAESVFPKREVIEQAIAGDYSGLSGHLGDGLLGPFGKIGGLLGTVKNPRLDKTAKEWFGRTFSPDETGYIMDDGFRLDFSGRHYATGYEKTPYGNKPKPGQPDYLLGGRNVDHRELGELTEEGGTEGMLKFMEDSGAVRYMRGNGITVMNNNMPSQKQIETIVKDFRKSGYPLYIDVVKPNGYSAGTIELERPTVESVMDFIKKHQEGLLGQ